MRIAYLVSHYPAISHTFILREVRTLRQLGFEIHVASINPQERPLEKLTVAEREETATTFYVKTAKLVNIIQAHLYTLFTRPLKYFKALFFSLSLGHFDLKKVLYGFFYFIEAIIVGHWMKKQNLSHLHVHFATAAATVGMVAKQVFSISYSITVHGPDEFYDVPGYSLKTKVIHADFICCISYFASSQLMMLCSHTMWNKFEICPLGVDPSVFAPRPFRENPSPLEIICVGRLVPVKGQFILLEAIAKLIEQGRKLQLRFIGDGPDRANLEQEVSRRGLNQYIFFEGAVNQERILEFYKYADVFALASFAEGVPVVLMEAMMMEIPCVTTHITGIPELIKRREGILVTPAHVEELMKVIALLMDRPSLRRQLGEEGRTWVLKNYDLRTNTERLASIFQKRIVTK